jgi:MoaA/NifB/PqqE/SkfB family radical SAM enzyme
MIKFTQLKQLHLEISSACQASCPMCTRNVHGGLPNPLLSPRNWTLEEYKNVINDEVLNQVESIYFCGNFGDPLMNNDLLDMCRYSVEINPKIDIRIHTNGSLRSTAWWKELAQVLPKVHNVVFAIDGLEDTHSLYRIGTNFTKIIDNAKAFISAGGIAEWAYLRFKHNEHQVDQARQLANDLGFSCFLMKDSSRWLLKPEFPVYDKSGNVTHYLEPSNYSTLKFIDKNVIDNYQTILKEIKIDCHAVRTNEAYIDANGHLFPCCWLASIPYTSYTHEGDVIPIKEQMLSQYYNLVNSLGGISAVDTAYRSVKDIIESDEYQSVWDNYWNENKLITCARSCGKMPDLFSIPKDQFITRENLND